MELSYDYKNTKSSKKAKTIFSVLASANRVDILKILNSKGPLTYSELKEYAGFKSKKESGKFAYHLRKLTRQSLIALNRGEKKYTITNLGKLVLNLVRQIEERSLVESGKIYIRTTKRFQEFNTQRVMQLLIRDAGVSPEIANKIAEEVESKIFKLNLSYLTEPILLEIINNTLLEHGYEEYRERLSRVGMAASELSKFFRYNINDLMYRLTNSILEEYMLFSYIPKDIADQHIEGNINIPSGLNAITYDTLFIDVTSIDNYKDPYSLLQLSSLIKEASKEVVFTNIEFDLTSDEIARLFDILTYNTNALLSFVVKDGKENVLEGYKQYLDNKEIPKIGLILKPEDSIEEILELGGLISIGNGDRSIYGVKRYNSMEAVVHSISINLPRLAYESNNDEMYFRAKLAMMLDPALEAIKIKHEFIANTRMLNKDLNAIRYSINLIDPYTAINKILAYENYHEVLEKTINTVNNILSEKEDNFRVSIIHDNCISRFLVLDLERYGKNKSIESYNEGIIIDDLNTIKHYAKIDALLDGSSIFVDLDATNASITEVSRMLDHFIPMIKIYACNKCKRKGRYDFCKLCNANASLLSIFT
ncbi:MAG: hypothetical protein KatS3mg003_2109 [Candidatus Nitrosocaldaceae archaeon]|nr:MAG: hypothetical protein KatS3mg003_2050 [Candidatus Nitrosocaldaceae archaeon]GIU72630.1 MAG: hypothetical protein KatS3mg003_2109 [Candidatus Nitrosocaldaceae archaeon]